MYFYGAIIKGTHSVQHLKGYVLINVKENVPLDVVLIFHLKIKVILCLHSMMIQIFHYTCRTTETRNKLIKFDLFFATDHNSAAVYRSFVAKREINI